MIKHTNKVLGVFTVTLCLLFSLAEARMKSTKQGTAALPTTSAVPISQSPITLTPATSNPITSDIDLATHFSVSGGSSGGAITYSSLTPSVCTVSGNRLTREAPGTCTVTATMAGGTVDSTTYNAVSSSYNLTIPTGSAAQNPLTLTVGTSTINVNGTTSLTASGGSGGGAVTYTVTSGACTVLTNTLIAHSSAGSCSVTARKAGGLDYAAQSSTAVTVTVSLPSQDPISVTLAEDTDIKAGSTNNNLVHIVVTRGGSGPGPWSFVSTTPSICTVSGNRMDAIAAGNCIITATKGGTEGMANISSNVTIPIASSLSTQSFTLNCSRLSSINNGTQYRISQQVGHRPPTGRGNCDINNGNDAGFGIGSGTITFSTSTLSKCTVTTYNTYGRSDWSVWVQKARDATAGTCTIVANKAADSTYSAATSSVNVPVN